MKPVPVKIPAVYRIAHFSDFHIDDDDDRRIAIKMIKDAVGRGINHILITGDLLARANMGLAKCFWQSLTRLGWAGTERCSFVPGNHDVYAVSDKFCEDPTRGVIESWRAPFQPASRARAMLAQVTRSSRRGACVTSLCQQSVFASGKVLADGAVVLAMADTTRKRKVNFLRWQEGELPDNARQRIRRFFGKNKQAPHRILAIHHSPLDEDIEGGLNQLFADPKPREMLKWIEESGATLVCCGHIHQVSGIRKARMKSGCIILRAGVAGGMHDDKRAYHLIELHQNGKASIRRIDFRPLMQGSHK